MKTNILADRITESYIKNLVLPSDPAFPMWNRENFVFRKKPKWNYIDSCMIKAVLMLYEITGNTELFDYAVNFTGFYIGTDGSIPTMNISDFNLDNVNGGKNLLYIFKKTGSERYRLALEKIYSQIESQPRLKNGNFWHKAIYPRQIWLDGIYMALPFMAEYAEFSGDKSVYDDIYRQLENVCQIMRDEKTGLYFHGYDEPHSQYWADSEPGFRLNFG